MMYEAGVNSCGKVGVFAMSSKFGIQIGALGQDSDAQLVQLLSL